MLLRDEGVQLLAKKTRSVLGGHHDLDVHEDFPTDGGNPLPACAELGQDHSMGWHSRHGCPKNLV